MSSDEQHSEKETERRRDAAIAKMLATPPKPFTPKTKGKASPKSTKTGKDTLK